MGRATRILQRCVRLNLTVDRRSYDHLNRSPYFRFRVICGHSTKVCTELSRVSCRTWYSSPGAGIFFTRISREEPVLPYLKSLQRRQVLSFSERSHVYTS